MKYYFDTNVIIDVFERNTSQYLTHFQEVLKRPGNTFLLSEEHMFELAQDGRYDPRVRKETLKSMINLHNIRVMRTRRSLLEEEFHQIQSRLFYINPFEDSNVGRSALRSALEWVKGNKRPWATARMNARDELLAQSHIPWIEKMQTINAHLPRLKSFQEARSSCSVHAVLQSLFPLKSITEQNAAIYIQNSEKCLAIKYSINASIYMAYRAFSSNRDYFRPDLAPDMAHIAQAAYCDVFVTGDQTAHREAQVVLEGKKILSLHDFILQQ